MSLGPKMIRSKGWGWKTLKLSFIWVQFLQRWGHAQNNNCCEVLELCACLIAGLCLALQPSVRKMQIKGIVVKVNHYKRYSSSNASCVQNCLYHISLSEINVFFKILLINIWWRKKNKLCTIFRRPLHVSMRGAFKSLSRLLHTVMVNRLHYNRRSLLIHQNDFLLKHDP